MESVFGIYLVFLLFFLAAFAVWIVALVDVVKSDFRGDNDKLIWILVIVLAGFIGAIIYFVVGRQQKIQR